jgi:hypothetical protein
LPGFEPPGTIARKRKTVLPTVFFNLAGRAFCAKAKTSARGVTGFRFLSKTRFRAFSRPRTNNYSNEIMNVATISMAAVWNTFAARPGKRA